MTYAEPVNMTGIVDIFEYANSVSSNTFGVGIIIALYLIIFISLKLKGEQTSNCFIVAGFITVIPSIFFLLLGLINGWHLFITISMIVIPVLWQHFNND